MRDIMYELPSRDDVHACTITKDVITGVGEPLLQENEIPMIEEEKKEETA